MFKAGDKVTFSSDVTEGEVYGYPKHGGNLEYLGTVVGPASNSDEWFVLISTNVTIVFAESDLAHLQPEDDEDREDGMDSDAVRAEYSHMGEDDHAWD